MIDAKLSKQLTCQMCGTEAIKAFGNPPQPSCRVCGATLSPNAMAVLEMEISKLTEVEMADTKLSKRKLRIIGSANGHLLEAASYLNELKGGERTADLYDLECLIEHATSLCNKLLNESYVEMLNVKESEK
jgi:hypothetical protein